MSILIRIDRNVTFPFSHQIFEPGLQTKFWEIVCKLQWLNHSLRILEFWRTGSEREDRKIQPPSPLLTGSIGEEEGCAFGASRKENEKWKEDNVWRKAKSDSIADRGKRGYNVYLKPPGGTAYMTLTPWILLQRGVRVLPRPIWRCKRRRKTRNIRS